MTHRFSGKLSARTVFYILLSIFIISLIPLYVIGMYAHPSVDDYYYGTETVQIWNSTHSVGAVFSHAFNLMLKTYNEWQGNFSAIFLMRLEPGIFGEQYYFIAPFILITSYVGCSLFFFYTVIKKIFGADKYRSGIVALSMTFVSMQLTLVPSDSFYWYNGSIYYTFFYSLMLLLFAVMIRLRGTYGIRTLPLCILSVALAFFIGGSNYATALFTAIILALSAGVTLYFVILKKNTIIKSYHAAIYVAIAIACMAGLFISMSAPGNAVRQASVGGSTGIIKTFIYTFAFGGYSLAKVLSSPCLIFFICMVPVFYFVAAKTHFSYHMPLLVLIFTFGLYCSAGTPVFYAQGLRIPYRMMNIIFFSAYSFIGFNMIYFLGWLGKKYGNTAFLTACTNVCNKIKQSGKCTCIALALCLSCFLIACIGQIDVGETEYKSGNAGFGNMPMSISAIYSLATGEAKVYDAELTARDKYLRETDELHVAVPALSVKPELIYHTDITSDPGDWRNAHLAMFYRKEIVWSEEE